MTAARSYSTGSAGRAGRHPAATGAGHDGGARGLKRRASGGRANSPEHLDDDGSSATRPLAHEGPVTGILATSDGLNLVTTGSDNRVRLWDSQYLHNRLVHFVDTYNRGAYPKRLSSTPDGRYLFYPRGDDIQV